ncbi:hypothetical protein BC835DRAFT_1363884 [Cytidiella melzeri]|nr:hypothetical protein BC835DRAFT_1363884 [Cytidiella melzeri]
MSGPPTPPPSSALELEDAARLAVIPEIALPAAAPPANAPPQLSEQPTAQLPPAIIPHVAVPVSSPYRQAFNVMIDHATQDKFEELVQIAELADLYAMEDDHPERLLVTAPLVLSYLILDDIPPAIHALGRLPNNLVTLSLPRVLFDLAASVSERKYQNVYTLSTQVHEASQGSETADDLKPVVGSLLDKFVDRFRRKAFALLSRAYTSVSLSTVQSYLALPVEQVLIIAAQYKWGFDSSTQTLSPVILPKSKSGGHSSGGLTDHSTLATFNLIASINLE